jgi:hypothetical protein
VSSRSTSLSTNVTRLTRVTNCNKLRPYVATTLTTIPIYARIGTRHLPMPDSCKKKHLPQKTLLMDQTHINHVTSLQGAAHLASWPRYIYSTATWLNEQTQENEHKSKAKTSHLLHVSLSKSHSPDKPSHVSRHPFNI